MGARRQSGGSATACCRIGRKSQTEVLGRKEYYIDLLFYHRFLKCLVAVDLKLGERERDPILIDYDGLANNVYEVTEEWAFHNGHQGTREDVVFLSCTSRGFGS